MKIFTLYIILGAIVPLLIFTSCEDEEKITPSDTLTGYTVPQGNNDFDQRIVALYESYGTCFLYKFTDKDAYWTPSAWVMPAKDEQGKYTSTGYLVEPAVEEYVDPQLDLLETAWLDNYSDSFLKEFLPVRVLLCSQIDSLYFDFFGGWPFPIAGRSVGAWFNYDHMAVSFGNEGVLTMTGEDSLQFKQKINLSFINSIIDRKKVTYTEEFYRSVNYKMTGSPNSKQLWALGILPASASPSAANDWNSFMQMMVTLPEDYLYEDPGNVGDYDKSWHGLFHSKKDSNGLLKKRYEMVRKFFIDGYDMDLQTVGNGMQ